MLESLVASILNRVLGSYVENFDPKQLQIGLLSGDVKLHNLKLKHGALDQLQLPLNVVNGHIGSLVLQIPYSNLKSKPVKVFVDDVFLVATPDVDAEAAGEQRRQQAAKREKLASWELQSDQALDRHPSNGGSSEESAETAKQQNFTTSLVTKIVENLQVRIRNIHVRFEDPLGVGVALGATLGELSALSTNADWEPAFIADVGRETHKLVTLDSLAFYVDSEVATSFCDADADQEMLLREFKAMIFDSVGALDVLRPINGQGFVTIKKPEIKADLRFEELSVNLDREQYVGMLRLVERFQQYYTSLRFRKHRPKLPPKEAPLAWFRYAASTVLQNVRERNRVWTWDAISARLNDRKRYVEIYKRWYAAGLPEAGPESADDRKELEELEARYSYADIVFFRTLAKQALLEEFGSLQLARRQKQTQQTWSQWLWGGGAPAAQAQGAVQISEKERAELLDVLDEPGVVQASRLELSFALRSAGIRLKAGDEPLASAGFSGVRASVETAGELFKCDVRLGGVAVSDLSSGFEVIRTERTNSEGEGDDDERSYDDDDDDDDFLHLVFSRAPDSAADSDLFVRSQSVVLVHNARLMDSVMHFFEPPPDQGLTVDAILSAANRTVEELREQTRLGLEYALENHKTLNLQLDIQAPTIILPLDASEPDSAALVLEVGALEMASDLVPQNVLLEVKSRQALQYTREDWRRLESLMYDRFTIKLKDTQILLGESFSEINRLRAQNSSTCHFLDKTTLQFLLEISIVPNNASLTRCRLSIGLPSLRATLSDAQYLLFMKIIAAATPRGEMEDSRAIEGGQVADKRSDNDELLPVGDQSAGKQLGTPSSQPQRMFELQFLANEVHFFVVKGWKRTPLVDMCLHDFQVKFWTSNNISEEALAVDVAIRDLLISDHIGRDTPAPLRKIAESAGHASGDESSSASDYNLFSVQFRRTYSGDISVNINLEAMNFVLNPASVLEVYDYVMSTFTQPDLADAGTVRSINGSPIDGSATPIEGSGATTDTKASGSRGDENETNSGSDTSGVNKINVKLNMRRVSALLVDERASIASLAMENAVVNVDLLDAMKAQVVLGSVSVKDSTGNDVLSIEEGSDLAHFRYETKPLDAQMRPTGPSLVYLRMGRVNVAVLEEPLTQIVSFLSKLTAMKSAYDQARMMAFNQAIQVEPGMFLFDIVIKSPVIYWPCEDDWIRLNVGEVFFCNSFDGTINNLKAGIQNAQVTSSIHGVEREIVPKTALNINVVHTPDDTDTNAATPIVNLKSSLSPINVYTSEHQYKLMMLFLTTLSRISQGAANAVMAEEEVGKLRQQLAKEKHIADQKTSYWWGENFQLQLGGTGAESAASKRPSLNVEFEVPSFNITLEMEEKPLSRFSIREVAISVAASPNSGNEVNFHIRSFSAEDLGNKEKNKFTQVIPPVSHSGYQLMGRILQEQHKPLEVECSVDSPQVIVALEYMLRLKSFVEYGIISNVEDDDSDVDEESHDSHFDDETRSEYSDVLDDYSINSRTISSHEDGKELRETLERPNLTPIIKVDIVDMYLTVVADESDESSEAIVFKIEQLMFNSNAAPTIEVSKIGMYLMKMQLPEEYQLRILDDFNITCWFDNSESTDQLRLSNARVKIDALVLRISLREICLISSIAAKASAIYSSGQQQISDGGKANTDSSKSLKSNSRRRSSAKKQRATNFFADDYRVATRARAEDASGQAHDDDFYAESHEDFEVTRVLSEQLTVEFEGFRLVLIDPIHQLPLTDFCIKPFTLDAKNWSDSLVADAKAELYANVNSFTKSAWEPLIDTMEIGLSVTNDSLTVYSDSTANFELTTETLELYNDIMSYFSNASTENILVSHRDDAAPYRIRNETGMAIAIWNESKRERGNRKRRVLKNNEEVKWTFYDWRELRENLNVIEQDYFIGIEFQDNYYEPLQNIALNRTGEHISVLKRENTKDRLIVDIWVDNHLKYVVIRSPFTVHNHTEKTLEVKPIPVNAVENSTSDNDDNVIVLEPNTSKPLPLKHVDSRILVRKQGDKRWSEKGIYWKDIVSKESEDAVACTLKCENDFLLEAIAQQPDTPMSKVYPYLEIHLSAPFQIINNLPRDVVLRLYSRSTRQESHFELERAGRALIHDYSDDSLLLLRVDIEGYKCNKFAVINTGKKFGHEFHTEDTIEVSQNNQSLRLHLEYVDLPEGHGRVIVIYSPYVMVNNTNQDLVVSSHTNRLVCAANSASLWSFSHEKSRGSEKVTVACSDSYVSQPVHIEASGTTAEVKVVSRDRQHELYFGVSIAPGSGRYVNSKIVTFSPRFIIYNTLDRPLLLHEVGGNQDMHVDAGAQESVGYIFGSSNKEMCMRFADSDQAQWSSSFAMSNVGSVSVRVAEKGKPTILVKAEVILEKSTLFVHLSKAKSWPFSIRNFTDREYIFYQSDPFVDEDGDYKSRSQSSKRFTPITYRLPPRSAMPYSWDFPAASIKQVILEEAAPKNLLTNGENPPPTPKRPPQLPPRSSAASSSAASILSRQTARSERNEQTHRSSASSQSLREPHTVKYRKIQLAEIGELPPANFGHGSVVDLSVIADGPQLALVISPYNAEASHYDPKTNKVKAEAIDEMEEIDNKTGRTYHLDLKGIGISCITPESQELFYVTLHNLKVSYNISDAIETLSTEIQWIQVDNSLPGASDFPVIIYPTVLPKAAEELAAHPCFSASVTRMCDDSYGVAYIKHATLLLQEMSIEVDEDFLLGLVKLVVSISTKTGPVGSKNRTYIPLLDDNTVLCDDDLLAPRPSGDSAPDIYFEQLHLQPIQLNLSFVRTGSLSTTDVFKDNTAAGSLAFIIDALTLTIGNVNVAPLRFNALLVDNVRTHLSNLVAMIQVHYQQEFMYQLHKVLGSADIIGNPVGLFNNISSGVMDLFYEPYLGYTLQDRPSEFGVGLAKGGLSFMKKSVFGISDSISKVTGSLSKGLTAMTLDSRYQKQQRARRSRNRPKHLVYGLRYGLESFYDSFSSGMMGLAEQPMQGALTDGASGFFKGMGVGLLGLPTKTGIGLLDLASNLTEGIRNTTTVFDVHSINRVRLPRVIAADGVVRPYNARESVGQMLLHSVRDGRYSKDHYLAHSNITKNKVVIVSLERVMVASINENSLDWSLSYSQVESIAVEQSGIVITLRGGAHGPFIPLQDATSRQYIYENIGKGVMQFQQKRIELK